jgi:hypothetical protein
MQNSFEWQKWMIVSLLPGTVQLRAKTTCRRLVSF